jgi:hypothetical protein
MYTKQALKLFVLFILTFAILFTGCNKKEEKQTEEKPKTEMTSNANANNPAEQPAPEVQKPAIADLRGTYTGVFDKRPTTLIITEQTEKTFKGKITINYREVINQEVTGEFDPDTKKVTMKDMLHSRYAGTYSAKLSDDLTKLTGTFTMNVDKTNLSFSLTKK